jgi:hypothetical protein
MLIAQGEDPKYLSPASGPQLDPDRHGLLRASVPGGEAPGRDPDGGDPGRLPSARDSGGGGRLVHWALPHLLLRALGPGPGTLVCLATGR